MAKPSIWNFLRDPESQRSVGNGLLDAANRGMVANSLGSLVDLSTNVANLGIAGAGYIGHKTGLLSQPPELIDSRNVPGSSEWIGQKMQNAGMVSPNRNALAELGMGLLSPVAYKGAQRVGGVLYGAEQNALANLANQSTMRMQGQRGVIEFGDGGNQSIDALAKKWSDGGVKLDVMESKNRPIITLSKIVVPEARRGGGIGSGVMSDLVDYAEKNGKTITLSPSVDFGGSSVARLREFYKRFGFVENKGRFKDFEVSDTMYRPPSK